MKWDFKMVVLISGWSQSRVLLYNQYMVLFMLYRRMKI